MITAMLTVFGTIYFIFWVMEIIIETDEYRRYHSRECARELMRSVFPGPIRHLPELVRTITEAYKKEEVPEQPKEEGDTLKHD